MPTERPVLPRSGLTAEVDMSGDTFAKRFLKQGTAAGQANRCGATTDDVIGVLYNRPKLGRSVTYVPEGVAKVVAGGAVAVKDSVSTDNQGRAVTVATTARRHGIALSAAAGAGEVIEVELRLGTTAP